jgi:hypothetical protein
MIQDECDTAGEDGREQHGNGRQNHRLPPRHRLRRALHRRDDGLSDYRAAIGILSRNDGRRSCLPSRRGALPHGVAALPQCSMAADGAFGGAKA